MDFSVLATTIPACDTNSGGIIGTITEWLVQLMNAVGGIGVAIAVAAESIFPPIPSEVILPLAGFTAARGGLDVIGAIIWATVGSLVGALALYGVAWWIGLERLERIADKIPGVSRKDIAKANGWFERYGTWSVVIGRIIPVVRSLISIPAGFNGMNLLHFSGWTVLGSGVWNTLLVGAGYLLGDRWCSILSVLNVVERGVLIVCGVALVVFIIVRVRRALTQHKENRDQ
ncbi:DedA family protein [Bifidobacterium tsurumiense]|uniref:Membrane protein DedA family protein n=1 Tax=Bifidobacterium tsurumiense TaxID=356829 RepID=A0A087EFL1_9BIFI|nr:Membrane protein DedA family protein [Bifidobacterium tsurumiense]